jgi:hypothetical protein
MFAAQQPLSQGMPWLHVTPHVGPSQFGVHAAAVEGLGGQELDAVAPSGDAPESIPSPGPASPPSPASGRELEGPASPCTPADPPPPPSAGVPPLPP